MSDTELWDPGRQEERWPNLPWAVAAFVCLVTIGWFIGWFGNNATATMGGLDEYGYPGHQVGTVVVDPGRYALVVRGAYNPGATSLSEWEIPTCTATEADGSPITISTGLYRYPPLLIDQFWNDLVGLDNGNLSDLQFARLTVRQPNPRIACDFPLGRHITVYIVSQSKIQTARPWVGTGLMAVGVILFARAIVGRLIKKAPVKLATTRVFLILAGAALLVPVVAIIVVLFQ